MRQRAWRAWSVWLRWISNQGNGPAHLFQPQPWSRSPEVPGPPWRSWGRNDGGITPLQGTPASASAYPPPYGQSGGLDRGLSTRSSGVRGPTEQLLFGPSHPRGMADHLRVLQMRQGGKDHLSGAWGTKEHMFLPDLPKA